LDSSIHNVFLQRCVTHLARMVVNAFYLVTAPVLLVGMVIAVKEVIIPRYF